MRRQLLTIMFALPLVAADPHMTADERTKVLGWLEASRQEFLASIEHVSDAQWKWKPAPERWSVGEVAEHIVLAEAGQFANVKKALAAEASPDWEQQTRGKTEMIEMVMAPRLGKATAPEPLVPGGKMTREQARERFAALRVEMVKFARETTAPLKEHLAAHPMPVFDPLNAYQWLIYAPLHTQRHLKQIAEVKATAGYPE
jgi:uncharacterized damage-inducible protein DinB